MLPCAFVGSFNNSLNTLGGTQGTVPWCYHAGTKVPFPAIEKPVVKAIITTILDNTINKEA